MLAWQETNKSDFIRRMTNRKRLDPESVPAIARRLQLLRQAVSGSQAELCARLGFNRTTWNTYETARGRISVDFAMALHREFGVPLDWIYMGISAMLPTRIRDRIRDIEAEESVGGKKA